MQPSARKAYEDIRWVDPEGVEQTTIANGCLLPSCWERNVTLYFSIFGKSVSGQERTKRLGYCREHSPTARTIYGS